TPVRQPVSPEPRTPPAPRTRSAPGPATENGPQAGLTLDAVRARWPAVLEAVRHTNKPVEALLKDAQPSHVEDGNVLVLEFRFAFHCTKVQEAANRITVEKALRRALGMPCKVRCVLKENAGLPFDRPRSQTIQDDPIVAKALRIWRAHLLTPGELAAVEALPTVPDLSAF
ncbi:MAG: hypothetical protein ACRDI2_26240, partial [Chloroflexota bacterium]